MKSKTVLKDAVVFSLLILVGIWGAATLASPNAGGGSDVVVKKNADGSVDAYDAGQSAAPSAGQHAQAASSASAKHGAHRSASRGEAPTVNIIYRLKNDVGTRRINGVNVRTNPDGTIETFDNESAPTPMHHSSKPAQKKHK
jgi:hypothetical protein